MLLLDVESARFDSDVERAERGNFMLTIVKKTFQYPVNLLQVTLIVFAFAYLFVAVFMKVLLDHNFMISDVAGYWQDSLHWREPFHPFHVPGYPLAIAFIRGITGGVIEPVVIMMLLNILALIGCLYFVYKITSRMSGSDGIALAATILFGLWPLVGLTYTVVPLADIPTLLLYLAALYYLQKDNWVVSSILFGLSMITHKAIWPYVGLTIVFHLIKQGNLFTRKAFLQSILVALPLGLLWMAVY